MTTTDDTKNGLDEKLNYLKLSYMRENYESLAKKAVQKQWTHVNYLTELTTAEANQKRDRATKRRIRAARFPQIKTLEQQMFRHAQDLEFEEAAKLRDEIQRMQEQNMGIMERAVGQD